MTKPKYDDTRCDHQTAAGENYTHRVSNVADDDPDWREKSFRSAWVCGSRACTIDAQAWALRAGDGTGTEVFTYAAKGHECDMCEPVAPREPVSAAVKLVDRPVGSTPEGQTP